MLQNFPIFVIRNPKRFFLSLCFHLMNAHRLPENSVLDVIKLHKIKDKKMLNFECFTLALIVVEHKPFISEEWLSIQTFQNNVYTMLFSAMTYDSMEGSKSMRFQTFFSMRAFAPNKIYNIENTHKLKFQFQFGSTTCMFHSQKKTERPQIQFLGMYCTWNWFSFSILGVARRKYGTLRLSPICEESKKQSANYVWM